MLGYFDAILFHKYQKNHPEWVIRSGGRGEGGGGGGAKESVIFVFFSGRMLLSDLVSE